MRPFVLLCLLATVGFLGCDSTNEEDALVSAVGLDEGTTFSYRWSIMDTSLSNIPIDSDILQVKIAATGEEVGPHKDLIRIEVSSSADKDLVSDIWYRETEAQVVEIAYRNSAVLPLAAPKQGKHSSRAHWSLLSPFSSDFASKSADSTVIRDESRVVYRLPLTSGQEWTSFSDPFVQTRKVVGTETVTVEAGTFECVVIASESPDTFSNVVWHDYVAKEGLVLRVIKSTFELRDTVGNLLESTNREERLELTSID